MIFIYVLVLSAGLYLLGVGGYVLWLCWVVPYQVTHRHERAKRAWANTPHQTKAQ